MEEQLTVAYDKGVKMGMSILNEFSREVICFTFKYIRISKCTVLAVYFDYLIMTQVLVLSAVQWCVN